AQQEAKSFSAYWTRRSSTPRQRKSSPPNVWACRSTRTATSSPRRSNRCTNSSGAASSKPDFGTLSAVNPAPRGLRLRGMQRNDFDVIVVGARVAGASAAMLLARAGHKVLLLDRGSFPSEIAAGHFVHRHGPQRLQRWG